MKRNMKLYYIQVIISLILFNIVDLRADGSPIVYSIIVRGDYTFVEETKGLYTIHKKDNGFHWDLDHDVYSIYEAFDGRVWTLSGPSSISPDIRCFDGDNWIEYSYPKIKRHDYNHFFCFENKSYMIAKDCDREIYMIYTFDGLQWKEETCLPDGFSYDAPTPSIYEDNLELVIKREYYLYSFSKKEWNKKNPDENKRVYTNERRAFIIDTLGRGYIMEHRDLNHYGKYEKLIFTSPEGNAFVPDDSADIAYPFPAGFDEDGYCYIKTQRKSDVSESEMFSKLWSDRGGKWEVIATGDICPDDVVVSNSPKFAIWGSLRNSVLAFVRDGKWVEVAILPPQADAMWPDENGEDEDGPYGRYEWLLEQCDDSEGMVLGEINDPDGYVNVRSQPGAWALVVAIILKDVPFFYKDIGNDKWSKVLLPSGTIGYVSTDRINPDTDLYR